MLFIDIGISSLRTMLTLRLLSALSTILFLVLALPLISGAQEFKSDSSSTAVVDQPGILYGHVFIPTSFIIDPFVRTSFRTSLGFGQTPEIVAPLVTVGDTTIMGSRGSLLYAVMEAEYQQAIRRWIAVRLRMRMVGRLADETPALIKQGVTLYTGVELGWLFSIAESDRFLLSGSLGATNISLTDVNFQRFIDGILSNGTITSGNKLVESTPSLRVGGGAHGAYAFTGVTGLTFSGDLEYGEQADRKGEKWNYRLAAAIDFDLSHDGGTPIGFAAGMSTQSNPAMISEESNTSQAFFGRIAYTGTRQFALGLDLSYLLMPIRGISDKQGFISATVDIRLFF